MAGVRFTLQTAQIATGTTKKTVVQVVAPTNQRVLVKEWSISFKGTSNTAAPILVEVLRQSTAGTGGTALTPVKDNAGDDEPIQSTALKDIVTTQPTDTDVRYSEEVHPQGGYTWQAPFGGELVVKGGERLGLAVTAGADVNCTARFVCEE